MEDMTPFDVVAFLFLLGWFILGYVQGTARRIFGIIGLVFSLLVAAQLTEGLGNYLAGEWTTAPPGYSHMVAFGALFLAFWISISVGIQWAYHSAPLFPQYPALDEVIGGILGVVEGGLLLLVLVLVMDPFYRSTAGSSVSAGEFQPLRSVYDFFQDSLTAGYLRDHVISNIVALLGFLFPHEVRETFGRAVAARQLA